MSDLVRYTLMMLYTGLLFFCWRVTFLGGLILGLKASFVNVR
jgi:hypothetical protein